LPAICRSKSIYSVGGPTFDIGAVRSVSFSAAEFKQFNYFCLMEIVVVNRSV
jgi:hypothetical protein